MNYAYVKLGNTGLCNMLFPWARAVVYCRGTRATLIAPAWTKIWRLGPWVRHEKDKRYYVNTFTNQKYCNRVYGEIVRMLTPRNVKVFCGMSGYFDEFINDVEYIRQELLKIVNTKIIDRVQSRKKEYNEFIGCHIRRGDFKCSGHDVDDEWYINAINIARKRSGINRVLIFTDASEQEMRFIMEKVPEVEVMPPAPAIEDLLLLSKAEFCVCTKSSTFSMWAVYLGQMQSIWHSAEEPPRIYANGMKPIII